MNFKTYLITSAFLLGLSAGCPEALPDSSTKETVPTDVDAGDADTDADSDADTDADTDTDDSATPHSGG